MNNNSEVLFDKFLTKRNEYQNKHDELGEILSNIKVPYTSSVAHIYLKLSKSIKLLDIDTSEIIIEFSKIYNIMVETQDKIAKNILISLYKSLQKNVEILTNTIELIRLIDEIRVTNYHYENGIEESEYAKFAVYVTNGLIGIKQDEYSEASTYIYLQCYFNNLLEEEKFNLILQQLTYNDEKWEYVNKIIQRLIPKGQTMGAQDRVNLLNKITSQIDRSLPFMTELYENNSLEEYYNKMSGIYDTDFYKENFEIPSKQF